MDWPVLILQITVGALVVVYCLHDLHYRRHVDQLYANNRRLRQLVDVHRREADRWRRQCARLRAAAEREQLGLTHVDDVRHDDGDQDGLSAALHRLRVRTWYYRMLGSTERGGPTR